VWFCTPKEYTAFTKVSDEYKEMDLAIGLSPIKAQLKNLNFSEDLSINNMETYCKILKTEDFARSISHKQVPDKRITYGEYLDEKDTIESIKDRINYNYSSKQETLTISFTDKDPVIAAQILDSITTELQTVITQSRHQVIEAAINNAKKQLTEASQLYKIAQKEYASFTDSNNAITSKSLSEKEHALLRNVTIAKNHYTEAVKQYSRQIALKQRTYQSFTIIQSNTVPTNSNDHLVSYLLVFIIIGLLATATFRQYSLKKKSHSLTYDMGDFFSPWSLTLVVWAGEFLLYFLQGTLDPIGPLFVSNFIIWLCTFIPASFLTFILTRDDSLASPIERGKSIDVNMHLFYALIAVSLLFTILYAKWIYGIVSQFDSEDLLYNIRLYAVYKDESPGILILTQGLNFSLFLTAIWLYPKISKWTIVLIVAINLLLEFSMMEKSGILIMILSTLFVLYEKQIIKLRSIGFTLLGIIVLFFFFNLSKESKDQNSMDFIDFLGIYVTSPIVAFEKLQITITNGWGVNTFNDVFPYLRYFGIHLESIERLQDFVFVPVPTNVYTIMQPFYNDFGSMGVAIFGLLYGWGAGFIYRKFYDGSNTYKCIYTFLVEVIIIQFYNENLLQQFHIVLETFFFVVLLTATNHKFFTKVKTDEVVQ
jgi:oligosaccharide repeat unit polymerase